MYSDRVIDHFSNPRNVGTLPDADGMGRASNPKCGDLTEVYLKVADGVIAEVRYRTFGCAVAIAASSLASELALGRSLAEAAALSGEALSDALGELPEDRRQCAYLGAHGLRAALQDYLARHPKPEG